jgi:benzoyl-CoA reductase/2-hydroxyglutaryl-CoA dehydratase subunit BcrC/BadD/HgdB
MKTIAYASPFVPPEWIAAHGLRPEWIAPRAVAGRPAGDYRRGVCPYAAAIVEASKSAADAEAVVLTTACDQMRYAAARMEHEGHRPVFLMNIPSTWQSAASATLYLDELKRLGRFLVTIGGSAPDVDELASVMLAYDRARRSVREARCRISARHFAQALADVRRDGNASVDLDSAAWNEQLAPLALVGGPLLERDFAIFDGIEEAGGRVVLDATETGERTLPAPLEHRRTRQDPLPALVDAYFGAIPDVFRRPNHKLYQWLGAQIAARQVRGIVLRRYVWCDLWHAELERMRCWSPVPVLEIDVCEDGAAIDRARGRIEAFLESLK